MSDVRKKTPKPNNINSQYVKVIIPILILFQIVVRDHPAGFVCVILGVAEYFYLSKNILKALKGNIFSS
jgi:hypothetical protein